MPHKRQRLIAKKLKKSLSFWPITCVLGPRQCGKSTFVRDLYFETGESQYFLLDRAAERLRAIKNPALFLTSITTFPAVIDEAHKAPPLFDEIKGFVDGSRRPGMFVLTGSVQFSKKIGISESFTGRASVLYMDAMTIGETLAKPPGLQDVQKFLVQGGLPGVCFLRDQSMRESYWTEWIETTCHRDLHVFSKGKLSGDLAYSILDCCAKLELPSQAEMARKLRVDGRRIANHVQALVDLFVVREVPPHSAGIGKSIYLPFDPGLANFFEASLRRRWQCWFLLERINQGRFSQSKKPLEIGYYLTRRKSFVDFTQGTEFHLFSDLPTPDKRELLTAKAARVATNCSVLIWTPETASSYSVGNGILVKSWADMMLR